MQPETGDRPPGALGTRDGPVDALVLRIVAQLELAGGAPEPIQHLCRELEEALQRPPSVEDAEALTELARFLTRSVSSRLQPVVDLLERTVPDCPEPWAPLREMLRSRQPQAARQALELTCRLVSSGMIPVGDELVDVLAARIESDSPVLDDDRSLNAIADIVGRIDTPAGDDPLRHLLLGDRGLPVRRLAARLLDLDRAPPDHDTARALIGADRLKVLAPYLEFTGAGHRDLLDLSDPARDTARVADDVVRAAAVCGETVLRAAIAELGWSRVALGVEARALVGVRVAGSVPLWMGPREATLVAGCCARGMTDRHVDLVISHGGAYGENGHEGDAAGPIERFRDLNLLHSELLQDFLDVAPLTVGLAHHTVARMDRMVDEFADLFADHSTDCEILVDVYRDLRDRVANQLENEPSEGLASAEVTRLVKAFEDPANPGEVRTLHGLKRLLHQKGLQLGPRLAGQRAEPRRSVDIAMVRENEAVVIRRIRYVSFESAASRTGETLGLPYPVRLLVEAYAAQLLHGHRQFPHADVFCYGNEVHIYLAYRNHPAFLRIDLSPPLRGGMVDLEYFGISAYEHDRHPSPELAAVTGFLRELGFQVTLDGTRIHARCDKESVLDLGTLCARADAFLRLTPYLMDLDWIIGSLDLDSAARSTLIQSWASAFRDWGALPLSELLSDDRRGVLAGVEIDATGPHAITWSGSEPLRDRFNPAPPYDLPDALRAALHDLGIETPVPEEDDRWRLTGQMRLEKKVLKPLRDAVARRQLVDAADGYSPAPPSLFELEHEAVVFAARLARGVETTKPMIAVARMIEPLERSLRFHTTGHVAGREIQRAVLGLLGDELTLYVLRDARRRIRLALYSVENTLFRRRSSRTDAWLSNARDDADGLALILRRNNYQFSGGAIGGGQDDAEAVELLREISSAVLPREPGPLPGERVVTGLPASPGRVVGPAVFTTESRRPQDLAGAVLVSASLGPEDTVALFHSGGVVSTGGGVLSHAGLIAIQFHKPALTVQGDWQTEGDGSRVMVFSAPEYREVETVIGELPVVIRTDYQERRCTVREGDLLVVNATLGTLRVLGQERSTLAIYDELRRLGASGRRLQTVSDDSEVLTLRGHRVRCRHRLQRLLGDLEDPVVARWVVREMLLGDLLSAGSGGRADRTIVLEALLGNPTVGAIAHAFVERTARELAGRLDSGLAEARRSIIDAKRLVEILQPRLDTLRLAAGLADAEECLASRSGEGAVARLAEVDGLARQSLRSLRARLAADLEGRAVADPRVRHIVRELDRIAQVLPPSPSHKRRLSEVSRLLAAHDDTVRRQLAARYIIRPGDGGLELVPLIGAKAANLGEIGRLLGNELVPPWFSVTDTAFREVLSCTPPARVLEAAEVDASASTLAEAIEAVLADGSIGAREQSRRIRQLWDGIELPPPLLTEVVDAYHDLTRDKGAGGASEPEGTTFVALRSSSLEEDVEQATRAGEFETFLFVSGRDAVLDHLKRTWSGLWTERAIHNRAVMRSAGLEGGGVLVQRIVWSRVSGVALTVNVGANNLHEIVINAGLGLGEGIVSGAVAADLVTVSKNDDLVACTPRITYMTADKLSRVVFNRLAGAGTVLAETLFHQRLRPALEYVELRELVSAAARLENAYGYPLDIEFAWENHTLWILQARPVATFFAALRDTVERFPLVDTRAAVKPADDLEVVR